MTEIIFVLWRLAAHWLLTPSPDVIARAAATQRRNALRAANGGRW